MSELDRLLKKLDDYEVVSFDIFDTLLLRNVQRPVDIFKILESIVEKKYNINDFFEMRVNSEMNSRTEKNNYETTLDEIYKKMPIKDKTVKEEIKKLELKLESDFLIANPFMQKVYNYCLKNNKKVVCISDMYLPLSFLETILNKNGYKKVKIYLSCVHQKHKGNGTLYEEVYNTEKFDKTKWIHIGDNYECDYVQAINFGISAHHYPKVLDRSDVCGEMTSIASTIINAIRNNTANNGLELPYWQKFGILNASPIYFAFANWVYKRNVDHDNIYFLARDGYIIKKVYDKIIKLKKQKIDSRYLYTSRRAIQLPMLMFEDKTKAIDTLASINRGLNEKMVLKNVFNYFNMDLKKYEKIIKIYGFNSFDEEIDDENFLVLKQMLSEIYDDFKLEMSKKVDNIKAYLEQEKVNDYEKVFMVDIGWRGSVQYALDKVIDKEVFGYYFCTNPYVYNEIFYNTQGFLINFGTPFWLEQEVSQYIMLYEFLFSAPEGSLKDFTKKDGKIVPVLGENTEYSKEIAEVQNSALEIIDKFMEYYDYITEFSGEEAVWPYRNFILNKKYEDLVKFSHIKTNVGYAGDSYNFVPTFSKKEIEEDPIEFMNEINKSMWNGTFLVKEIDNSIDYEEYKKHLELLIEKEKMYSQMMQPSKIITYSNFKKAIKHPVVAIKKLKDI